MPVAKGLGFLLWVGSAVVPGSWSHQELSQAASRSPETICGEKLPWLHLAKHGANPLAVGPPISRLMTKPMSALIGNGQRSRMLSLWPIAGH